MTATMGGPAFGDVTVHGDAAQNAIGNQVDGDLVQSSYTFLRGRPSMYLGSEEITDRLNCYVAAGNHTLIVKTLERDRAVVLTGPPGSGRETTAVAAMRQLSPGVPIRRFSLEDEDAEEIYARGGGYLVHATDGGLPRLGRCVDAVRASGGHLVVIKDDVTPPIAAPLASITVEPPHPVQVYRHRVVRRGLTEWPHWDGAVTLLANGRPGDARRLTDLIEEIGRGGGDLRTRQAQVIQAYRGWGAELRAWFDAHQEPHERALLVAAAALSPAEEANVYTVASALARRLEIVMNGAGLAWCPAAGVRDLLGAEQDDERIVFRRHGFTESVLRHALADYPLARSDLLHWLADLPTDWAVPPELRHPLAGTFADLAAEYGGPGHITGRAWDWGRDGLADLAFIALFRTCLHPRVGGRVRKALYEWSRGNQTPQTLRLVIARVCEPLGQTYPSIALTRLKHLATRGNRQVHDEVILAAHALAGSHGAEVLAAALAWCAETNEESLSDSERQRRRRVGAIIFLEQARRVAPSGLPTMLDRGVDPFRCVPGWRAALDVRTGAPANSALLRDAVHPWLETALGHARVRARIVGAFVEAAGPVTVPAAVDGMGPAAPAPPPAEIMIALVRSWAALDRTDRARRKIKEDIVIPLIRPRWLQRLMMVYVRLRTWFTVPRKPR